MSEAASTPVRTSAESGVTLQRDGTDVLDVQLSVSPVPEKVKTAVISAIWSKSQQCDSCEAFFKCYLLSCQNFRISTRIDLPEGSEINTHRDVVDIVEILWEGRGRARIDIRTQLAARF